MSRYVIRVWGKSFLGRYVINKEEKGAHVLADYKRAAIFNSLKEAKTVWKENKAFLKDWDSCHRAPKAEFLEAPSKGLALQDGEVELFCGISENPFDDKEYCWERKAVKEITPQEALTLLANFQPEIYKDQPTFYFWEDDVHDGQWSPLYGYMFHSKKYITVNLVGAFYARSCAGVGRIIDSNYLMPITWKGELRWCNLGTLRGLIKEEGLKLEEVKPAFETSLDVEKFMNELKKGL